MLELDDGRLLSESGAILFYLAEGTPYLPEERFARAGVWRWMFFEQYSHEPDVATPRFWITHNVEMTEERRVALETKRKLGYEALGVMEGHLKSRDFFVGGRYSVADIALYAYTHVAWEGGFDLDPFAAVHAWLERVESQPAYVPITLG